MKHEECQQREPYCSVCLKRCSIGITLAPDLQSNFLQRGMYQELAYITSKI